MRRWSRSLIDRRGGARAGTATAGGRRVIDLRLKGPVLRSTGLQAFELRVQLCEVLAAIRRLIVGC